MILSHCGKLRWRSAASGQTRRIDTLAMCPPCSLTCDNDRLGASQRTGASCHKRTPAPQQTSSLLGVIGNSSARHPRSLAPPNSNILQKVDPLGWRNRHKVQSPIRRSTMARKLSGGCACGAIHYECNADPVIMLNCHCRDCQRASGSGYAAVVALPKAAVQMRGQPRYHKVVGEAGKAIERGFFSTCGGQGTMKLERPAEGLWVHAGGPG